MTDIESAADYAVKILGNRVVMGLPLGLGKPVQFVNAIYRRAKANPELQLTIITALSLSRPKPGSELEKRFLQPFIERVWGDYEELDYIQDQACQTLPPNVTLHEFYFKPGSMVGNSTAQQNYISTNYTFVARDINSIGVNLFAQMVSPSNEPALKHVSLSCNPEVTLDLLDRIEDRRKAGETIVCVGQLHPGMPYMAHEAEVETDRFDVIVDDTKAHKTLFSTPNMPVEMLDYFVGLNASVLLRDNGTLQIGIGALGDALVYNALLRHKNNLAYGAVLSELNISENYAELIAEFGGIKKFSNGLYGCSEMFINGFYRLIEGGVIKRQVFNDLGLQCKVNNGEIDPTTLDDGVIMHGGFFLGPTDFYQGLKNLSADLSNQIHMKRISYVNHLYGDEDLKRAQRQHARFINTVFNVNLLGAAAADQLENGQVISGVGGQYNFVAQAHELEGARSILLLRSTRTRVDETLSNIVWSYGHTTIPRHLRDIVVTEYGIADLRGKPDNEVIKAMLNITDSRFQTSLLLQAVEAGKLEAAYKVPEQFRQNTPERLAEVYKAHRKNGLFPNFPFGSDFTYTEENLLQALGWLKKKSKPGSLLELGRKALQEDESDSVHFAAHLQRMGLEKPGHWREHLYRRLLLAGLKATDS
ncbi:MAG: acetyl-CoA hydrolase/transferase C-terminal domain-containing protein [Pseudomonadales bacterium]